MRTSQQQEAQPPEVLHTAGGGHEMEGVATGLAGQASGNIWSEAEAPWGSWAMPEPVGLALLHPGVLPEASGASKL